MRRHLLRAAYRLRMESGLRDRLSESARRQAVSRFDFQTMAKHSLAVYQDVLAGRGGCHGTPLAKSICSLGPAGRGWSVRSSSSQLARHYESVFRPVQPLSDPVPHARRTDGRTGHLPRLGYRLGHFLPRGVPSSLRAKLIVDLGANIGLFTLHAAAVAPEAIVVAVEPFPKASTSSTGPLRPIGYRTGSFVGSLRWPASPASDT